MFQKSLSFKASCADCPVHDLLAYAILRNHEIAKYRSVTRFRKLEQAGSVGILNYSRIQKLDFKRIGLLLVLI